MLDPARYFICGNSTVPAKDGMAKHVVVCPAEGADWTVIYVHSEELVKLRDALIRIEAIEDKMYGPDWEEIEEARAIATEALKCAK